MQANSTLLPTIALSIRQPWAWLIAHGFKDFENRDWKNANPARKQVQLATVMGKPFDVLIHAAGTCTVREYDNSKLTVIEINQQREKAGLPRIDLPHYGQLERGGIVGVMTITGWSDKRTDSPWSIGPGLTLANARPLPFDPWGGQLGFFNATYCAS